MNKELVLLKIRNLIADKEMITAIANRALAMGGWDLDYAAMHHDCETSIQELLRIANDPWIKVSDRLPEEGQEVFYYFKHTGIARGHYKKTEYGDCFYGDRGFLTNDVTHWMPFPKEPHG